MKKILLIVIFTNISMFLRATETDTLALLTGDVSKVWKIKDIEINSSKDTSSCEYLKVITFRKDMTWNRYVPCDTTQDIINSSFKIVNHFLIEGNDTSIITKITTDSLVLFAKLIVYINASPAGTVDTYTTYVNQTSTGLLNYLGKKNNIELFPNPFKSYLSVGITNENNFDIEIFDLCGGVKYQHLHATNQLKMDLSGLIPGIYFLKVKTTANDQQAFTILKN